MQGLETQQESRKLVEEYGYGGKRWPTPPFKKIEHDEVEDDGEQCDVIVDLFNQAKEEANKLITLQSSAGTTCVGGTCLSKPSGLAGMLLHYFREMLPEDIAHMPFHAAHSWIGQEKYAITSAHRVLRHSDDSDHCILMEIQPRHHYDYSAADDTRDTYIESYVPQNEHPIACQNLYESALTTIRQTKDIQGLLEHLENLGHESLSFCEGLNVELLHFQKHSVKWAIQREKYGLNSFLWTKLDGVKSSDGKDVYFNPVLDQVSTEKPPLCRGGLICEQMGLGKTIISLALILENPAPKIPRTGSKVSKLDFIEHMDGECIGWDPNIKPIETDKKKKASVLSCGTLVVCPVTLVGQWMAEAKSRLKNPGELHAYYGNSRKRDPNVLSKYSIVVTTYAVLASDASYWAKKSGDENYVAPCEQIRWWRVICDESHVMRSTNTKQTNTVTNIVADHKWCVTGTPISTSVQDLVGQLKYVGLEDANNYFSKTFKSTIMNHVNDRQMSKPTRRRRGSDDDDYGGHDRRLLGHFSFFMRNVLMRHSMDQTYKNTVTKLMTLPSKSEKTIAVKFSEEEAKEYEVLETSARTKYSNLKTSGDGPLSKHYLAISQMLRPLRVSCAGGHIPLDDDEPTERTDNDGERRFLDGYGDDEERADETDDEDGKTGKTKKRKLQKHSEFAFKSKLETLIRELKRIRDEEPDSKSLVFSQYKSTLEWLQKELPNNGFQFRTLQSNMTMKKRAKALEDFQNDPPTTIFLLSMRSSNCGINLTHANRVFLMEPVLNPATEKQAIGRVMRLGQKKKGGDCTVGDGK